MRNFRNYEVWHKSHEFALEIFKNTKDFPKDEVYGLRSQIRRAAYSIPTNIAEGCGRNGDKQFARFIDIAFASASESEYLLILTNDLNYIPDDEYVKLIKKVFEIKKMLGTFYKRLTNGFAVS